MANPGTNIFTILCESAVVDSQSNNATLINVLEKLTIPANHEQGVVALKCTLVSLWQRGDLDKADLRFEFVDPKGESRKDIHKVSIKFEALRHRVRLVINGLPIDEPGFYSFLAYIKEGDNWKLAGKYPLEVTQAGS